MGVHRPPGRKADGSDTTGPALVPTFNPVNNSKMNYTVVIANGGLTYTLNVFYLPLSATTVAYQTDQTGAELARLH